MSGALIALLVLGYLLLASGALLLAWAMCEAAKRGDIAMGREKAAEQAEFEALAVILQCERELEKYRETVDLERLWDDS